MHSEVPQFTLVQIRNSYLMCKCEWSCVNEVKVVLWMSMSHSTLNYFKTARKILFPLKPAVMIYLYNPVLPPWGQSWWWVWNPHPTASHIHPAHRWRSLLHMNACWRSLPAEQQQFTNACATGHTCHHMLYSLMSQMHDTNGQCIVYPIINGMHCIVTSVNVL